MKSVFALINPGLTAIVAMGRDAAERCEPHAEANFYPQGSAERTIFQIAYLDRRAELQGEKA